MICNVFMIFANKVLMIATLHPAIIVQSKLASLEMVFDNYIADVDKVRKGTVPPDGAVCLPMSLLLMDPLVHIKIRKERLTLLPNGQSRYQRQLQQLHLPKHRRIH